MPSTGGELAQRATVAVTSTSSWMLLLDEVVALYYAMPHDRRGKGGCVFVMHPDTMGAIIRVKTGDGRYVYGDLSEAPPTQLLGCPVREDETMPRIGHGARSVLFVDFGTPEGREPVGPVLCLAHSD